MKTMFDKTHVSELSQRMQKLSPESKALWGKMSVHKMLCHLIDQMEFAFKQNDNTPKTLDKGPPLFMRHLIRLYLPWPKGVQTGESMLKTSPGQWEVDLSKALELMNQYNNSSSKINWPFHPFFGQLDGPAWARLTWRHNDHHLRQFGV